MYEHIVRMRIIYYFEVHLFYASAVGLAAWLITSFRGCSATMKYWIWVAAALNFVLPLGAILDRSFAPYLAWAPRLAEIGDLPVRIAKGPAAAILCLMWATGAILMYFRFIVRLQTERREIQCAADEPVLSRATMPQTDGVPVVLTDSRLGPSVVGLLHPRISLPRGIDRLLSKRELAAVLVHELTHARRRDNLVRLVYEGGRCLLWFHPLVWFAGSRLALYRELSCDESVIQEERGMDLIRALAKLADVRLDLSRSHMLHANLTSHLGHRLSKLTSAPQRMHAMTTALLGLAFAGILASGVLWTIADTVSCFLVKR